MFGTGGRRVFILDPAGGRADYVSKAVGIAELPGIVELRRKDA